MTIEVNQNYQQFVNLYGTEAAQKAQELGLFHQLADEKIDWNYLVNWAKEQGYERIPPPGNFNIESTLSAMDSYFMLGMLFHEVMKEMRTTKREDSLTMQQKVVDQLKAAADKKIEAADKLMGAAIASLVLTCVGAALSVIMSGTKRRPIDSQVIAPASLT